MSRVRQKQVISSQMDWFHIYLFQLPRESWLTSVGTPWSNRECTFPPRRRAALVFKGFQTRHRDSCFMQNGSRWTNSQKNSRTWQIIFYIALQDTLKITLEISMCYKKYLRSWSLNKSLWLLVFGFHQVRPAHTKPRNFLKCWRWRCTHVPQTPVCLVSHKGIQSKYHKQQFDQKLFDILPQSVSLRHAEASFQYQTSREIDTPFLEPNSLSLELAIGVGGIWCKRYWVQNILRNEIILLMFKVRTL